MTTIRTSACLVFVLTFGLFLRGLSPSLSVGDSGEFITAASGLGVPHPSGFPTFVIAAKPFLTLIPWGNPAYRINLFSALAATLIVVSIFGFCCRLSFSPWVALASVLLFAGSPALLVNARATEVFALHSLFVVGILWAAIENLPELAGLLMGLATGNHQTIMLLAPAVAWSWRRLPLSRWAMSIVWGLVGMAIYLALYLRATHDPFLNVGHPDTFERWWRVLTRADFGSLTLALGQTPDRDLRNTFLQLKRFAIGLYDQVGVVGISAGLLGLFVGTFKKSQTVLILLLAWWATGPFFFCLGNLPFDAQSQGLLERFYMVPTLCWTLIAAFGFGVAWPKWKPVLGVLLVALAVLAYRHSEACSSRHDWFLYDYGRNTLNSMAPNARLIIDGGDDTFYSLAYLTHVEHRREDIDLHDRGGIVFASLYGDDFRRLDRISKEARRQDVEQRLARSDRPLYFSTMNTAIMPGTVLRQRGLLYSVSPLASLDMNSIYTLRGLLPWDFLNAVPPASYRLRALVPFYAYQSAIAAAGHNRWAEAVHFFTSARASSDDVLWLKPNVISTLQQWAYRLVQTAYYPEAIQCYDELLAWDPTDLTALLNRGACRERSGNSAAAINDYKTAAVDHPESPLAHFNLAACAWKQSDWPTVISELHQVIAINPNYPNAQSFLMRAQAHQPGAVS